MKLLSEGREDTVRFGIALGKALRRGDTVCLFGDLGSGKTVFVKGVASAFGISPEDITSASFVIIAEYEGKTGGATLPFYHIDLYRTESCQQLDSLGLYEYIGTNGISVIEWAERIDPGECGVSVRFTVLGEETREITIEGIDEKDWHCQ